MSEEIQTTVVTAGDAAFAWGALLLVASMRRNGMKHPVVVGAVGWPDDMKRKILSLGGVSVRELSGERRCVACQKPIIMGCDEVKTPWVCWADSDAVFVGDCSEWLVGRSEDEVTIRRYDPPPPDFTPENLAVWRSDVASVCGRALDESRHATRFNTAFIVMNRKWKGFLDAWRRQMENVLPDNVEIIMKHGTAYFQTDESVLSSLLCFLPDAPGVSGEYKANGSADRTRYFAHFAYNPKPWQMWNVHSLKWRDTVAPVVDWLVAGGYVKKNELPPSLRKGLWPFWRAMAPLAPWVWRAMKLKRRLCR